MFSKTPEIHESKIYSPEYPQALYKLKDPPRIIYYSGNLDSLKNYQGFSVVGTRNCTRYGLDQCRNLIRKFQGQKISIISGLARGIDSQAHKSALEFKIPTIAILGEGILKVASNYQQSSLLEEILDNDKNLILSEFEPEFHADKWTFAHRNRIIAALSEFCIIIESPIKSGTLITANYAIDLKKKIYALTSDIDKESFEGNKFLLTKHLAEAIFDIDSFYDSLYQKETAPEQIPLLEIQANSDPEEKILRCLEKRSLSLGEIVMETGLSNQSTMIHLSKLEIKSLIKKLPGSRFQKS
jgi:DNA processing protein